MSGADLRAIFREQALLNMKKLSQYDLIKRINIGSYDLFYSNLENYPLERLEVEEYRVTVYKNTINSLDSYAYHLTEESLMLYLKENWIKYYEVYSETHEILEGLSLRYKLLIVTNGFDETQRKKVHFCNIKQYFQNVMVSSEFGLGKPHKEFYLHIIEMTKATPEKSVMIGDSIKNDIVGADNVRINTIFICRDTAHNRLEDIIPISRYQRISNIKGITGVINQWNAV